MSLCGARKILTWLVFLAFFRATKNQVRVRPAGSYFYKSMTPESTLGPAGSRLEFNFQQRPAGSHFDLNYFWGVASRVFVNLPN
jgi:hypothetical protein